MGLANASIICGAIAFFVFPVIFGPLGIVFGVISWKSGNSRGLRGLVVSVAGLVVGMIVGALLWS